MADEYTFGIKMDSSAVYAELQKLIGEIGKLREEVGGKLGQDLAKGEANLVKVATSMKDVASAAAGMGAAAKEAGTAAASGATEAGKGSAEWQALATALKEAQAAYRTYRQESLAGNEGGTSLASMSSAEVRQLIATYEAANANIITDGRKRLAEEERQEQAHVEAIKLGSVEAEASIQRENERRIALVRQSAEETFRTEGETTAAVEEQINKRIALYGKQYEAMIAGDKAVADAQAAQNARRYSPGDFSNVPAYNNGVAVTANSRNGAAANNSLGFIGGASTLRTQAPEFASTAATGGESLTQMRSYYQELERTSAADDRAAEAEKRRAAATATATKATDAASVSLPRARYALYDISTFGAIAGASLTAVGAGVVKVATEYEAAFASVRRTLAPSTTPTEVTQLRTDLINLSTQIPATFADITKVATLGNQLGVPAGAITGFTKAVSEFSVTTGVSTDTAATAFGRLGAMLKTTDYQRLGDEISYLGVNAVATEGDIIKVSQQIVATTTAYGFSEQQTLALATAYASLGIKAESARGTTMRSMNQIAAATQLGGTGLAELASVSGMTEGQFKKVWGEDASGTFSKFVAGLQSYGSNAKNVLKDLGITASRDVSSLMLLAQNPEQLAKAQDDVTKSRDAMNRMFLKQNDTVAGQMAILQNKWLAFVNGLGTTGNPAIRAAVDVLNTMANALAFISHSPAIMTVMALGVGFTTLAGMALIAAAALARVSANFLAFHTAREAFGAGEASLAGILRLVITGTTEAQTAQDARAASAERLRVAIEGLTEADAKQAAAHAATATETAAPVATRFAGAGNSGLAAADGAVTTSLSSAQAKLNVEMAETHVADMTALGDKRALALEVRALTAAEGEYALALAQEQVEATTTARDEALLAGDLEAAAKATEQQTIALRNLALYQERAAVSAKELGDAQLAEGAAQDAASFEKSASGVSKFSSALGKAGLVGSALAFLAMVPDMVYGLQDWERGMEGIMPTVDDLTLKIAGLSNKNTRQQSIDAIKQSLSGVGGDTSYQVDRNNGRGSYSMTSAQAAVNYMRFGQTTPGGQVPIGGWNMNSESADVQKQIKTADQGITNSIQRGDTKGAADALKVYDEAMKSMKVDSGAANAVLAQTRAALNLQKGQSIESALAVKNHTSAIRDNSQAWSTDIKMALAGGTAQTTVGKSLDALGASFVKNGIQGTIYGGALQKTLADILAEGGTGPQIAGRMQILFDTLVKGGYASAAQLAKLAQIIKAIGGGKIDTSVSLDGLDQLAKGYNTAADAANKQAKASKAAAAATARTTADYANDLTTVFGASETYRFGVSRAQDTIDQKWQQVKQSTKDARDQLKGYLADLANAKQAVTDTQYYLGIANRYGDTQRAGDLQAKLAEQNKAVASAQKQVDTTQAAASKTLVGHTAAAIQNRSTLYDMVDGYKAYIASLAESGASQEKVGQAVLASKQQFIDQATQMGFSRLEVGRIASSFDDFSKIVKAVPRNVTTGVTANTDPALAALADYRAKLKSLNGQSATTTVITKHKDQSDITAALRAAEIAKIQATTDFLSGPGAKTGIPMEQRNLLVGELAGYETKLKQLYTGGWTGDGGIGDPAGIVHGQEFVLNHVGAQMFPRAALEAANQGQAPILPSMKAPQVHVPANLTVSLSAMDRLLLGQSQAPQVTIASETLASATDAAFAAGARRGSA